MVNAQQDGESRQFLRAFAADVRRHIDAIASRYILPDEGTFPFALMYIPAENIYYEVIVKEEGTDGKGIYQYALDRRVVPVSPNSFYAYLQVIALGLRGLQIEESAMEILSVLSRLDGEIAKVREALDVLGTHLENARKKFDDADRKLAGVEQRLDDVSARASLANAPNRRETTMEITDEN